ncbi:hypothetical protein [Pleomorphomonas koreensis]|uniref:hypothetical protein n=1 Tax=Pleomorphomonas koreensis TaxID=257440 RepID=UPI001AEC410A|nr:hypothetical protein [Pleomorphomonas koreensis]
MLRNPNQLRCGSSRGPFYHEDPDIDVAAFRLGCIDINTPHLELGHHYDDWINDEYWMLSKATAFGYPPIPFTKGPMLVAASVEINAVIDTRLDRYVRFVVSGAPRGGFSGGPVFHEWGFGKEDRERSPSQNGRPATLSLKGGLTRSRPVVLCKG